MNELTVLQTKLHALNSVLRLNRDCLSDLESQLKEKQAELDSFELDQDDYIDSYEEWLNECNGEFLGMTAAYILKNCDETAYRCGLNDYVDSMDKSGDQNYKEIETDMEEIEGAIQDTEDRIEEIEAEIEEIEADIADIDTTDNGEHNQ